MRGDTRTELTPAVAEMVAIAGAEVLGGDGLAVARDTRGSGPALSAAIHSGVAATGGHSVDLGVVPTPAAALWCAENGVPGAVVSASHNPWHDNGIKFFAPGGLKLDDDTQAQIQERFDRLVANTAPADSSRHSHGPTEPQVSDGHDEAVRHHIRNVVGSLEGRMLTGMTVVVDAANGAATPVAVAALSELGAAVESIHCSPDGRNINDHCGSTHPEDLQRMVVERGADAGVAFDGDADRLIAVGPNGKLVDGDHIIAMCALDRHARGALTGDAVVITVMTNLGFRRSMSSAGIEVVETAVGDRNVLEALDRLGLSLGGEQSGHVIFREISTTGDGLLTAVQLLDLVNRSDHDLGTLAEQSMRRLPQVLVNVATTTRRPGVEHLLEPLTQPFAERLGDRGRILVRSSGTEPLVRVMVEAETNHEAESVASQLADQVRAALA